LRGRKKGERKHAPPSLNLFINFGATRRDGKKKKEVHKKGNSFWKKGGGGGEKGEKAGAKEKFPFTFMAPFRRHERGARGGKKRQGKRKKGGKGEEKNGTLYLPPSFDTCGQPLEGHRENGNNGGVQRGEKEGKTKTTETVLLQLFQTPVLKKRKKPEKKIGPVREKGEKG